MVKEDADATVVSVGVTTGGEVSVQFVVSDGEVFWFSMPKAQANDVRILLECALETLEQVTGVES